MAKTRFYAQQFTSVHPLCCKTSSFASGTSVCQHQAKVSHSKLLNQWQSHSPLMLQLSLLVFYVMYEKCFSVFPDGCKTIDPYKSEQTFSLVLPLVKIFEETSRACLAGWNWWVLMVASLLAEKLKDSNRAPHLSWIVLWDEPTLLKKTCFPARIAFPR